jgi:hypothetical protein
VAPALASILRGNHVAWPALHTSPTGFVEICDAQQVTPLVERRLRDGAASEWPSEVLGILRSRARTCAALEVVTHRELLSVLDALTAEGISPIFMKGTALAYSVYESPSLRPRFDTDLWIRPDEADRVRRALAALGYSSPVHCDGELLFCQFPLRRTGAFGVEHCLDVHWKISTQSMFAEILTYDDVQARTVPLPALRADARALGPVDALLLACVHPAMHHRNAELLIWVHDVHLLAESLTAPGFEQFVETAMSKRVAAVCAHQLSRSQALFQTSIPGAALAALAQCRGEPSAAYLDHHRRWMDEVLSSVRGLPRWRDRLRLLREIVFPSPGYMRQSYGIGPSLQTLPLVPLLYLHRMVFGGWKLIAGQK